MQILCKTIGAFYAGFSNTHLLVEVNLTSVCLIGNADHIVAGGQKLQILGKFLNGREINAAASPALQFFAQFFTGLYANDRFVTYILLEATNCWES